MNRRRPEDFDALLRAARADAATPDEQRALLDSLAARLGGGPLPPGGGEGAPPFHASRAVRTTRRPLIGIAAAVGGAALIAWWMSLVGSAPAPSAARAPGVAPALSLPPESPVSSLAAAPDLANATPIASAPIAPSSSSGYASTPSAPTRTAVRSTSAPPSEASLIERARNEVRVAPSRALLLTNDHLRLWPDGQLASEREVIAIEALVRLGRRNEAVARADVFRAQHPSSIYSSRIAALLGDAPGTRTP